MEEGSLQGTIRYCRYQLKFKSISDYFISKSEQIFVSKNNSERD